MGPEPTPENTSSGGRLSALLAGLGVLSIGAAAGTALAQQLGSEAAWVALKLERAGLVSGDFFVAGAVALGLAAVCSALNRVARGAARTGGAVESVEEMGKGMLSLRTRISRLHLEITGLQESNKVLLRMAQDQSAVQASGMQLDAIFRLAASMDQLGERLEDRLREQDQSLSGHLGDLTSSMLSAREQIEDLLASPHSENEANEPSLDLDLDAEALLPELPEVDELELEVLLESFEDADSSESFIDPAQFDWGAGPDPEDAHEELESYEAETLSEDDEQEVTPSEGNELQAEADDAELDSVIDSGLGLLDELNDYGIMIDVDDVPSLIPVLEDEEPKSKSKPSGDPNMTGGEDLLSRMLSEQNLQEALENARRRPIE